MKKRLTIASIATLCVATLQAAPLGRMDVPPTNVDVIRQPVDAAQKNSYSIEAGLGFISYDWDIGSDSFKSTTVAPQVFLAHSVTPALQLRAGIAANWLSDSDANVAAEGEPEVMMDPSLTSFRPSAGVRLWANRDSLFPIYLDTQLNYYFSSGDEVSSRSSMASISLGAGTMYAFDSRISGVLSFVFETSFKDGEVRFNGEDKDLSIQGIGLIVGMNYDF